MSKSIYDTDFTEYLPEPLKRDESIYAIAKAATDELLKVSGLSDLVLIYSRIDELPEDMLDILAYDFHCDWYDASYPVDIKRRLLKSNVIIHKRLGTKYAVERALTDIYQSAAVQEWFEYGGNPYFFKVNVTVNQYGISEAQIKDLVAKMWFYKNLRSHCDGFFYSLKSEGTEKVAPIHAIIGRIKVKPRLEHEIIEAAAEKTVARPIEIGRIKVKPYLDRDLSARAEQKTVARLIEGAAVKVKPLLNKAVECHTTTKTFGVATERQSIKVKAYVPQSFVAADAGSKSAAYVKTRNKIMVRKE